MNKLIVASLLAGLAVGCVTDDDAASSTSPTPAGPSAQTTPGAPVPTFTPKTCKEVVAHAPASTDGDYTLYFQNQPSLPWPAYCADMQSAPREYLTLSEVGGGKNTSMYKAGGASPGTDVVTSYQRLRIDPVAFTVDVGDQTFATSTGSLVHKGTTVTSMPFAVAMTCGGTAIANIDLSGTPFHEEDPFHRSDAQLTQTAHLSTDRKSFDMTVSGGCGWVGPELAPADPINDIADYALTLAYAP